MKGKLFPEHKFLRQCTEANKSKRTNGTYMGHNDQQVFRYPDMTFGE